MIMAGGAGTRLWPMSRPERPKQLLPLIGGRCLLELAADRVDGVVPAERRLICTGESYRAAVRAALPAFGDEQILGEPVGRDTVNAVGLTAAVLAERDPDAVFVVLTADHVIEPVNTFRRCLETGFTLVELDDRRFVTFAITPTFPATGYGYVERGDAISGYGGAFRARRFVEKPDRATAESYLATGDFAWNSGMFVFSARGVMEALERHVPESHAGLTEIARAWSGPNRRAVLERVYPMLPNISVDFALMEPVSRDADYAVCVVPMDVTWLDVGSWPSYGETLTPDGSGNRTNGKATHLDSHHVLAVSDDPEHLIATIGCEDLIVVHTRDATLVCPRGMAERVRDLVDELR